MAGKKKKVVNLHSSAGRAPNVLVFRSNESKKALTLDTQVDASRENANVNYHTVLSND